MHLSISREKFDSIILHLLAVFCVYANGSWFNFAFPTPVKLGLYFFLAGYLAYDSVKKKVITIPNIIVLFLAILPLFCKFLNIVKDPDLINTFSVVIMYALLGFYRLDLLYMLLTKYAEVIYFLCIVSIVFGAIFSINYSLINKFPVQPGGSFVDENGYHNLIIYTDKVANDFRVQGIFWEPGAWIYNLVFALYWYIFEKKQHKVFWVFIVGMLLAISTTGFILILIIGAQILFFTKSAVLKKQFSLLIVLAVLFTFLATIWLAAKTDFDLGDFVYQQTIDKLFHPDSKAASVSTADRVNSTVKAFDVAFANPLLGIGRQSGIKALFVTSSIPEIAYQLGFIYLAVFVYAFRVTFDKFNFLISLAFVFVMLNGEAYSAYILSSLIVIYGAKKSRVGKYLSYKIQSDKTYHA